MSWGAEDVKMISMELPPAHHMQHHGGHIGGLHHDPSYSPHQESLGSDGGTQLDMTDEQMQQDSKRKRKYEM